MKSIIVADDHAIVRRGIKQIILDEFPFAEIKEVSDGEELVREVLFNKYDIVIADISMPGRSGLEAVAQIKEHCPQLPVLILSMYPEEQYAVRALKAGASGYLKKDMAPEELVKAMYTVIKGKKYITASVAEKLASLLDRDGEKLPHELLSDRELEVFKQVAKGRSIIEISNKLSVSPSTISTYRTRILSKMGLESNADLTQYMIQNGLD